jgi:hypothetical protein
MSTFNSHLLTFLVASVVAAPMWAQSGERRATLTGSGGNDGGKCTVEVYVDGSADVELRGDRGFLRTRSGQPAQWRRFECSGPVPTNPVEFRFRGIDGRGRQELLQDPSRGNGAAIVRISDSEGGGQGYTFDVEWRGGGFFSGPTGQAAGRSNRWGSPNDAARACEDAVREKANQQYGFRDIDFGGLNADDNPGSNDRVMGYFDVRRGNNRETFRFSCSVDLDNARVRGVEISQARGVGSADRYGRDNPMYACQRAAEQKMQHDGYRNVEFGSLNADNRRNGWVVGTARAQRGNNGRPYDFDIGCSMSPDNQNVRSLKVNRR